MPHRRVRPLVPSLRAAAAAALCRPRGAAGGLVLALGLAGCGCPEFSEMDVTDPLNLGTVADYAEIRRGIRDFARWTGETGVCVPEVQLQEELSGGYAVGTYSGPRVPIRLVPGAGHETTVHELCHAIDDQRGWASNDHTRLFPVGHIDHVLYPNRAIQVQESFARICEFGPGGLDLQGALEQRCGWTLAHPGQAYVLDEIYTEASVPRAPAEVSRLETPTRTLQSLIGGESLVDVASGDTAVWLLTAVGPPGTDPENLGAVSGTGQWVLRGVDPASATMHNTHRFAATFSSSDTRHDRAFRLADAAGAPPLLIETALATTARIWEIDEDAGSLRLLTEVGESLGSWEEGLRAVRIDGLLYAYRAQGFVPHAPDEAGEALPVGWLAVDLETGALVEDAPLLAALAEPLLASSLASISATADGVQILSNQSVLGDVYADAGSRVYTVAAGSRVAEPVALTAAMFTEPALVTADGWLVGLWSDVDYWNGTVGLLGRAAVRLSDRRWALTDGTCDGSGPAVGVVRPFHLGDETWVLGSDGTSVLAQVRVD